MATSPNTVAPNAVTTQAILSTFDIVKPEIFNQYIKRFGDQGLNLFIWLWSRGLEVPTGNDAYSHYEDDWKTDVITIRTTNNTAHAAGAAVTLNINDTSGRVYVRVGDIIMFKGTGGIHGVKARVNSLNQTAGAATMTVSPLNVLASIPSVTAADEVIIVTNAFAEGTGQPIGRYSGFSKVTNNVQIIKESFGITGNALTDQLWFEIKNAAGGLIGYAAKGQEDMDYRFAKAVDGAYFIGERNTNTTVTVDAVTGAPMTTTEGLLTGIKSSGKTVGYTTTFELADFNTIDKYLTTQFVGGSSLFGMGIDLDQAVEDKLFSSLKMTGYDPTTLEQGVVNDLFAGNRDVAMSIGFSSFKKSDRPYIFKRLSGLSDIKSFGATGYNWSKVGFIMPNDKQTDHKTKDKIDSMRTRYKALGSYNRKLETWNIAGAGGGTYVTDVDAKNLYMRGHVGLETFGLNRFIIVEPA